MRADAESSWTALRTDSWHHWLGSLCGQAARRTLRCRFYLLFFIDIPSRTVYFAGITDHPFVGPRYPGGHKCYYY